QGPVDLRVEPPRRYRLLVEDQKQRVDRGGGAEGRTAGQALIEDGAQAIDVAGRAERTATAGGLLGRHVAGRADDGTRLRQTAALDALGQPKVRNQREPRITRINSSRGQADRVRTLSLRLFCPGLFLIRVIRIIRGRSSWIRVFRGCSSEEDVGRFEVA